MVNMPGLPYHHMDASIAQSSYYFAYDATEGKGAYLPGEGIRDDRQNALQDNYEA
jgi:hypothetical protein